MSKFYHFIHKILFWIIGLFVFLFPLFTLFKMGFEVEGGFGIANFTGIFESPRTLQAIGNTFIIAFGATAISVAVGFLYALIVAYTNIRFKRLVELLVILPYIIPGYVVTLSWTALFAGNSPINTFLRENGLPVINMYSLGGIILVLGISNAALVYLNIVDILRKVPQEQEWASRIAGYRMKETLRNINFRTVLPAIVSGVILAFLSSIDTFAITATLGSPAGITVLSTYIYE